MRVRPVPRTVAIDDLDAPVAPVAGAHAAAVGLGGDEAGPVHLSLDRGALVVGPPGSGRSTVLAVVAHRLLDAGVGVLVVARDGPLRDLGERRAGGVVCGFDAQEIARALGEIRERGSPQVVVVDDLDALEQVAPGIAAELGDLVTGDAGVPANRAAGTGSPGRPVTVLASAQTAAACLAYRGPLAALRNGRRGVVLGAGDPGSSEVFGVDLSWDTDPVRGHEPGLGVVVHGRVTVPVRVARLPPAR